MAQDDPTQDNFIKRGGQSSESSAPLISLCFQYMMPSINIQVGVLGDFLLHRRQCDCRVLRDGTTNTFWQADPGSAMPSPMNV